MNNDIEKVKEIRNDLESTIRDHINRCLVDSHVDYHLTKIYEKSEICFARLVEALKPKVDSEGILTENPYNLYSYDSSPFAMMDETDEDRIESAQHEAYFEGCKAQHTADMIKIQELIQEIGEMLISDGHGWLSIEEVVWQALKDKQGK